MHAKVQHYVPRFLLKGFSTGKKDQLHVFDKRTDSVFKTNVKNVAAEQGFYDFVDGDRIYSLEPSLSKLESQANKIIKRILDRDSLAEISDEERVMISVFLAVQFTRTRHFRNTWIGLPSLFLDHLMKNEEKVSPEIQDYIRVPDENTASMQIAKIMEDAPQTYGPHFENKTWVLFETDRSLPFIIGDNPLVLQNMLNQEFRGNLGIAVRGIEIYLPLTATRVLGCLCPSVIDMMTAGLQVARSRLGLLPPKFQENVETIERHVELVNRGKPIVMTKENVTNLNSLQIAFAERYIFSAAPEFRLAREMLATHPDLRQGPRLRTN